MGRLGQMIAINLSENIMKSYEKREQVLRDWKRGQLTVLQLAFKHDVAASTILNWTKEAGLPSRPRGRRVQDKPSSKVRRILGLCMVHSASEVARMVGVTKQHVSQLRQRWKDWSPVEPHKIMNSCLVDGKLTNGDTKTHITNFRLTPGRFEYPKQLYASERQSPYEAAREVVLRATGKNTPTDWEDDDSRENGGRMVSVSNRVHNRNKLHSNVKLRLRCALGSRKGASLRFWESRAVVK